MTRAYLARSHLYHLGHDLHGHQIRRARLSALYARRHSADGGGFTFAGIGVSPTLSGEKPGRKYIGRQIVTGFATITGGNGFITWGMQYVSSGLAAIIANYGQTIDHRASKPLHSVYVKRYLVDSFWIR